MGARRDNAAMPLADADTQFHHPDRRLSLDGASNFRDLGGYANDRGQHTRWRRLFRSDHLAGLSARDHATLQALGVRRSFDFRGVHERRAQAYALPGLVQHHLAIEPTVAQQMQALLASGHTLTPTRMVALMEELYRRLVDDEPAAFARWFGHLLAEDTPAVFHCTAGKDRTGLAAALLLRALGVPQAVVEGDYLLTNHHYQRPDMAGSGVPDEALAVLWSVRPSFLHAALSRIAEAHGGLDAYLATRLGVDDAARGRLAALYLERSDARQGLTLG